MRRTMAPESQNQMQPRKNTTTPGSHPPKQPSHHAQLNQLPPTTPFPAVTRMHSMLASLFADICAYLQPVADKKLSPCCRNRLSRREHISRSLKVRSSRNLLCRGAL